MAAAVGMVGVFAMLTIGTGDAAEVRTVADPPSTDPAQDERALTAPAPATDAGGDALAGPGTVVAPPSGSRSGSGSGGGSSSGPGSDAGPGSGRGSGVTSIGPQKVKFAPNNVWTMSVRGAPVDSNSSAMAGHLAQQVRDFYGGVAAFNAYQYNSSFYTVSPNTPKYDLEFYDCQGKGHVPDGVHNGAGHWKAVPIPDDAVTANGEDKNLTIYDPAADKLWEFWIAERSGSGWKACWGGRIDDVSSNRGYFPGHFGATATGLPFAAGMITLDEVRRGRIEHAMYLAIMEPRNYETFSWPAQRSDGHSTDPNSIPEGTRLRLPASIDVDSLGLTPIGAMVARAAQDYGFIVADKAGAVNVVTESGAAEQARTGKDPWKALLGGTPDYQTLKNFPWDKVEVMPPNWGK